MKKTTIVFVLWLSMGNCSWAQKAFSPSKEPQKIQESAKTSVVWQTDQAFTKQLGQDVAIGKFFLRPPKEYFLTKLDSPEGALILTWRGETRFDQTFPHLIATIVVQSKEEKQSYQSKEALKILLAGIEKNRNAWKASTPQEGTINGVEVVRSYWNGTDKASGKKMKGFIYVLIDEKTIINLASQDTIENEGALKLAEAAVLTFHK